MGTNLQIRTHIESFLKNLEQPFLSETHLQVMLAVYLKRTGYYDNLFAEYTFHNCHLGEEYQWGKKNDKVSVDIVVRKGEEYIPIELKFKSKQEDTGLKLFGCDKKEIKLAEQAAKNLNCYGFWKDVKRLELIKEKFAKVSGGFAFFVTNAKTYLNEPEEGSQYAQFSIHQNKEVASGTNLSWDRPQPKKSGNDKNKLPVSIKISGKYRLKWQEYGLGGIKLHYLLLMV